MEKKYLLKINSWIDNDNFITSSVIIDEKTAIELNEAKELIDENFMYYQNNDFSIFFECDGISFFELIEINDVEVYVLKKLGYISLDDSLNGNKKFALGFVDAVLNYAKFEKSKRYVIDNIEGEY